MPKTRNIKTSGSGRTRLTREGTHFVFLMLFVFSGAILRDVNLLVVLGGLLMAMLLLQWRLCSRTLAGLFVDRELPSRAQARTPFQVGLTVNNPRRWLASWLVVIEDHFRPVSVGEKQVRGHVGSGDGWQGQPHRFTERDLSDLRSRDGGEPTNTISSKRASKSSARGTIMSLMVPHIAAGDEVRLNYDCQCPRRGLYQFDRVDASTRFPLSLMIGYRKYAIPQQLIVQPAIGRMLPAWRELFQLGVLGRHQRQIRAGVHEGEFHGLRAYRAGDSQRWVHWRTTAKRNELSVKQFERQELYEASILVDLYQPLSPVGSGGDTKPIDEAIETAIEFVATLVQLLVMNRLGTVSVLIAGREELLVPRLQSRIQLKAWLDDLATVEGAADTRWANGIDRMNRELKAHQRLLVVSTRSRQAAMAESPPRSGSSEMLASRVDWRWLDVAAGDCSRYFARASA